MNEWLAMLVPVLGGALLQFLWQGVAIGLAAAIGMQLLRDARPELRYLTGCLALLACALLPAGSVLWGVASVLRDDAAPSLAAPVLNIATTPGIPAALPAWQRFDGAMPLVVALWAAGASVFCLRIGIGTWWLQRMRASVQSPEQERWQQRLDALAGRFGLTGVALCIVAKLDSPVAAGWLRPVVLLPAAVAARMPVELVEALLAHELAHVRRHDYLVNLLQNLVEALLFYHPVVWWLSRRVRIEREHIADAMAAEAIGDPRRLAHALATLSEFLPVHTALPHAAPAAHGGSLMSRIQHLIRPGAPRLHAGRIALPALGIAAACMAFYAQAQIGRTSAKTTNNDSAVTAARAEASSASSQAAQARRAASAAAAEASAASAAAARAQARAATPHIRANGYAHIDNDATREAFALVRKGQDGVTMSGSTRDMAVIESARRSLDGDFLCSGRATGPTSSSTRRWWRAPMSPGATATRSARRWTRSAARWRCTERRWKRWVRRWRSWPVATRPVRRCGRRRSACRRWPRSSRCWPASR